MDSRARAEEVARTLQSLFESGALADAPNELVDELALAAGELSVSRLGEAAPDAIARAEAALAAFHAWRG